MSAAADPLRGFEELGAFYVGRAVDLDTGARSVTPLLIDARDLVTHAVCVGMTGSGKTALCTAIVEEAALDGIPAIVIDLKGDLANLLLTFPELAPADFRPWIDEGEAQRAGVTPEALAAQKADAWRAGLAAWGQDGARIARLRATADVALFTPGSTVGLPVSIVGSLAAPDATTVEDPELLGERIAATAGALLGLLGVDVDPVSSREHVLVSTILHAAWRTGESLDLARLVERIVHPPFAKVGVLDLDAFYPAEARFQLAARLNNLLAAPGFAAWLEGEPLDVGRLLRADDGRPRVSIVSIAHLGEPERMFFMTVLLHAVVGWMRRQAGTRSLRALLFVDEIAGYVPPVANPPSKAPLLTLMKQGRAFGVGCLLATQNPVDVDYKALSNAGTWLLGKLQTERDKGRVVEGLLGSGGAAAAGLDRTRLERDLGRLGPRQFLLHDVHRDGPEVFEARWVLSYLAGPLTRPQLKALVAARRATMTTAPSDGASPPPAAPATSAATAAPAGPTSAGATTVTAPLLPPAIEQVFVSAAPGATLRPWLLVAAHVRWADAKLGVDHAEDVVLLAPLADGAEPVRWSDAGRIALRLADLAHRPPPGVSFAPVPPPATLPKSWTAWRKAAGPWLVRHWRLPLWRAANGMTSRPGEHERDFRGRLAIAAREERDAAIDALQAKAAPKMAALAEKRRKALAAVEKAEAQARSKGVDAAMAVGATVLGALLGRKTLRSTTTAVRRAGATATRAGDVERARQTVAAVEQQMRELDGQVRAAIDELHRADPTMAPLAVHELRPKKADVAVQRVALAWAP